MKQLTTKQKLFFNMLIKYLNKNNQFPCLKEIKNITNYKSYNTIYKYINILENKGYLIYDKNKKEITYLKHNFLNDNLYIIPFINENKYIKVNNNNLSTNNNYIALEINNNNLKSYGILNKDILIVEKNTSYLNNKFILIYKDYKYQVFKYIKKDGFHQLLNDKNTILLENTNCIIGKVVSLIRNRI